MLEVQPLVEGDVSEAVAIIEGGSLHAGVEDPLEVATYWGAVQETRRRGGEALAAVLDGEVVGFIQVLIFQHVQHRGGWCAELESVHVRGDRRGQNIGGTLLEAAVAHARGRGCYRIQLTSNNVRDDAHRFYVRHGFTSTHQGFKRTL